MPRHFTEAQLQERIKTFEAFLQDKRLSYSALAPERHKTSPFIISDGKELAKVSFSPQGQIFIIAAEGALKSFLTRWIKHVRGNVRYPYSDNTTPERVEELTYTYGDMLETPSSAHDKGDKAMTRDELLALIAASLTDKDFADGFEYGCMDYESALTGGTVGDDEDILDLIRSETSPQVRNRDAPAYRKLHTEPPALRITFGFLAGFLLAKFTDTEATDPLADERPENVVSLGQWRQENQDT